jgi:MOSC domain-containing protein YiiM
VSTDVRLDPSALDGTGAGGCEAFVAAVNVGTPQVLPGAGGSVVSAIGKTTVTGRVEVGRLNLAGDRQADLRVHGGPDKAVYAYAAEDLAWWRERLDRPLEPGMFGENLTTCGLDVNGAVIGERWTVGTTVLEVSQPRVPCHKLGLRFGDPSLPRRFAAALRPGAYLRVVTEGDIGAGDTIRVDARPAHGVTVGLVAAAYHRDRRLAPRLLAAGGLPASWQEWARRWSADHPGATATAPR